MTTFELRLVKHTIDIRTGNIVPETDVNGNVKYDTVKSGKGYDLWLALEARSKKKSKNGNRSSNNKKRVPTKGKLGKN